eukprot:942147_1
MVASKNLCIQSARIKVYVLSRARNYGNVFQSMTLISFVVAALYCIMSHNRSHEVLTSQAISDNGNECIVAVGYTTMIHGSPDTACYIISYKALHSLSQTMEEDISSRETNGSCDIEYG